MIDTVVLDLGGVTARFHPERRLAALAMLSGTAERTIEERIFDSGIEHDAEIGVYALDETLAILRQALDYSGPDTALIDAWALAFEPDGEILGYVASLGGRKALFTNNGPMLDACLAGPLRSLADVFGEVICSWHLGACKPDALAFERAAARLHTQPERLLLLDDSPVNVDAARGCGWDAECVTDLDGLRAVVGRRPSLQSNASGEHGD